MDLQELKQIGIEYLNETYQDHEHFDPGSVSAYFDNAVKRHKDYIHLWDIERLKQHLRSYFDSTFGEKKAKASKPKRQYIKVDQGLFKNNVMARMGITYQDILLIALIEEYSTGPGAAKYGQRCFASQQTLGQDLGVSRDTISTLQRKLINYGFMQRSIAPDGVTLHDVSQFPTIIETYEKDLNLVNSQMSTRKKLSDKDIMHICGSTASNAELSLAFLRSETYIQNIKAGKVLPQDPILSQEYTEICNRRKQSKQAREDGRSLNNVLHLNLGVK